MGEDIVKTLTEQNSDTETVTCFHWCGKSFAELLHEPDLFGLLVY